MFHSWQPLQGTLYAKAPASKSEVGKEDKLQCLRRLCAYDAQSGAEDVGAGETNLTLTLTSNNTKLT
jgi:hypothetical protein